MSKRSQAKPPQDPATAAALQEVEAAVAHLAARRLGDAEAALQRALAAHEGHPQTHHLLAELAWQRGKRGEALAHASRGLGWERRQPMAFELLARLVHLEGNSPLAMRLLEEALRRQPGHPEAQALWAQCLEAPRAEREHPELEVLARPMRFSLCMIVRNEAQHLARCLRSVRPHVDEMIVVDTGSTDDTVAIAKALGAQVHHFPWVDDFAAARNRSLELATGDWALVLDADESLELPQGHLHELTRNLPWPSLTGVVPMVWVRLYNHLGSLVEPTQAWEAMPMPRLFPRAHVRYQGKAHERPAVLGSLKVATVDEPRIELHHHGYRPETVHGRDKVDRNVALMRLRLAEEEGDLDGLYLLGRELVYGGEAEEGLALLRRFEDEMHAAGRRDDIFRLTHYLQAAALEQLKRPEEAFEALQRGLALDPDYPSTHYALGELHRQAGRFPEAIEAYSVAVEGHRYHDKHPMKTQNALTMAHVGHAPAQRREWCAAKAMGLELPQSPGAGQADLEAIQAGMEALSQGLLDQAHEHLHLAARLNPTHPQVAYLQAELAYRRGSLQEALEQCFCALKLGAHQAVVWALMGLLLHERHDSPLAAVFLRQALMLMPNYPQAEALLRQAQQAPRQAFHHPEVLAWLEAMQKQGQAQAKAQGPALRHPKPKG